jgi:uncharacterized protein (DUF2384 family)
LPKALNSFKKEILPFIKGNYAYFCFSKMKYMVKVRKNDDTVILESVPRNINDSEILHLLHTTDINWRYVNAIKNYTDFNDDILSEWLNVSVKTFREYKKPNSVFKENVKEQVLLLLSLIRHGVEVFGSIKEFDSWLNRDNFYFDNRTPLSFMNTVTGIKFIDDRLTAMEFGDNV